MKSKYFFLLVAGSVAFTSCKKDFLQVQPTQFTTPEQLAAASAQDPKLLNGTMTGLYTTMFSTGVGGTTGHDDFGQKGIDIYTDMLQSDMVLGGVNYGWYSNIANYVAPTDFTVNADYIPWRYYYRIIFGANQIIDILGGNNAVPAVAGNKYTMGQAKAMRAYGYFYLSQLYAKSYGDGSAKILPLYTTADPTQVNQPKSTTKAVYDQMISDLTSAIDLLSGYTRTTKDQVDINVAKGLLAYVLSARGTQADLQQVVTLTQDIMTAYPKTPASKIVNTGTNTATAGFNDVANYPSWMWGVDITLSQGLDLISWWGQVDLFTYSYAWAGDPKTIDLGLYNTIRADDVRKGQFRTPTQSYALMPLNKFYAPARTIGGQRQITTDYVYMRSDEFYLLNAEAKARLGQDAAAATVLSSYVADRIAVPAYILTLTGQALLNEIYLQERIELWGEGKTYFALKRLKQNVVRGANHLFYAGSTIPYNDDKLTFVIPQAEVLNNPNLNK